MNSKTETANTQNARSMTTPNPTIDLKRRQLLAGALLLALLAGCAQRDLGDLQQFVETTKRTTPVKRPDPPPEINAMTRSSSVRPWTSPSNRLAAKRPAASGTGWAACSTSIRRQVATGPCWATTVPSGRH